MSNERPNQKLIEMVMAKTGQRAVFRESGTIIPVTITEVNCGTHFSTKLTAVEGIRLSGGLQFLKAAYVFEVSAAWEMFSAVPGSWSFSCSGCCWHVLLNETACDTVVRLCKEKSHLDSPVLFELADLVCRSPSVQEIPDSVETLRDWIAEEERKKSIGTSDDHIMGITNS